MFALPPSVYEKLQSWAWGGHDIVEDSFRPLGLFDLGLRNVVEIGCGTGRVGTAIERHGIEYWGIEPDRARAMQTEKKYPGRVRPCVLADLPAWGKTFDAGLIVMVLHHLDDRMVREGFQLLRQCIPSGTLFVAEPIYTRQLKYWFNEAVRFADFGRHVRTLEQWAALFRDCGARGDVRPFQYGPLHAITCRLELESVQQPGRAAA
jgi:SAM-dependent methyltransferase